MKKCAIKTEKASWGGFSLREMAKDSMRRGNDDWEFRFENFDDWDLSAFKFWAAGEEGN